MTDHDGIYHRLFSDPRMVAELLRGFVAGPWLDDLDLDGMERLNAKFHAQTPDFAGKRRDGDVIWRIPRRDGDETYVLLLLEFQSRSDHWMALRALIYVGLLWQHLITEQRLLPDGRLPPVLPVVVFNGEPPWAAPLALHELVGLPQGSPLWPFQPAMLYYVVDEGGFAEADLAKRDGLLPLLFRLENSPDPGRVVALADALIAAFAANPALVSLRPIFVELLAAAIAPLSADLAIPTELLEVRNMLASRAESWKQEWLREGRQEGEAALLLRQLERRFGALPAWARERVATSDPAALEQWALRVLDAATLADVLA